jgi:hypothetical protein
MRLAHYSPASCHARLRQILKISKCRAACAKSIKFLSVQSINTTYLACRCARSTVPRLRQSRLISCGKERLDKTCRRLRGLRQATLHAKSILCLKPRPLAVFPSLLPSPFPQRIIRSQRRRLGFGRRVCDGRGVSVPRICSRCEDRMRIETANRVGGVELPITAVNGSWRKQGGAEGNPTVR